MFLINVKDVLTSIASRIVWVLEVCPSLRVDLHVCWMFVPVLFSVSADVHILKSREISFRGINVQQQENSEIVLQI